MVLPYNKVKAFLLDTRRLKNKKPADMNELSLYWLLHCEIPSNSHMLQTLVHIFGCHLELSVKSLLLKMTYT